MKLNKKIIMSLVAMCAFTASNIAYAKVEVETRQFLFPDAYSHIKGEYVKISNANQEEIGYQIGKIGKEVFNSILFPFADPKYGKEKEAYVKSVDTVYYNRVQGIKKALGLVNNFSKDATYPIYDYRMAGCSSIVIPASYSHNGHTLIAHNVDWIESPINEANGINKWAYVLEMYPTDGMASLALGSTSLIGAPYDAINEYGIYVAGLADQYTYTDPMEMLAGGTTTHFNHTQIVRSVVDNAKNLEEAKAHLIKIGDIYQASSGMHFLIVDKAGNSLVAEYDDKTRALVFSEFNKELLAFTNSAIRLNPSSRKEARQPENSYDDFYRYNTVSAFASNVKTKVSEEELWELMRSVAANSNVPSNRGANAGEISRLYWTVIVDVEAKTMAVKYNLRDGDVYDNGKRTELILSNPYYFYLQK